MTKEYWIYPERHETGLSRNAAGELHPPSIPPLEGGKKEVYLE